MIDTDEPDRLVEEFRLLDLLIVRTLYASATARAEKPVRTKAFVCRRGKLHVYSVAASRRAIEAFSCETLRVFLNAGSNPRDSLEGLEWLLDRLHLPGEGRPTVAVCSIDRRVGTLTFCGQGDVACSLHRKNGPPSRLRGIVEPFLSEDQIVVSFDGSVTFVRSAPR